MRGEGKVCARASKRVMSAILRAVGAYPRLGPGGGGGAADEHAALVDVDEAAVVPATNYKVSQSLQSK